MVAAFGLVRSEVYLELNEAIIDRDAGAAPCAWWTSWRPAARASTTSPAAWSPISATCCC